MLGTDLCAVRAGCPVNTWCDRCAGTHPELDAPVPSRYSSRDCSSDRIGVRLADEANAYLGSSRAGRPTGIRPSRLGGQRSPMVNLWGAEQPQAEAWRSRVEASRESSLCSIDLGANGVWRRPSLEPTGAWGHSRLRFWSRPQPLRCGTDGIRRRSVGQMGRRWCPFGRGRWPWNYALVPWARCPYGLRSGKRLNSGAARRPLDHRGVFWDPSVAASRPSSTTPQRGWIGRAAVYAPLKPIPADSRLRHPTCHTIRVKPEACLSSPWPLHP